MRKSAIFVGIFLCGIIGISAYGAITREQAAKLCAAIQKLPPESMDITYYETIQDFTRDEEQFRNTYKKLFAESHSNVTPEKLNEMVELNVRTRMKEQQEGRKVKVHVCYDINRQRYERTYGSLSSTGDVSEKGLGENTPYDMTIIEITDDSKINRRYEYFHQGNTVRVQTIKDRGKFSESSDIPGFILMPMAGHSLKKILGDNREDGIWEPNEVKIKQLCDNAAGESPVTVEADTGSPETKVKIGINAYNKNKKLIAKGVMICDRGDYSKVYESRMEMGTTGAVIKTETRSAFDSQGFPHQVESVEYTDQGKVKCRKSYTIKDVYINSAIADDVFRFDPNEYEFVEISK